ncbi:MAG: hypothetical protein ACFFE5_01345 [Candidatus Thorarchaeota archaeon]
MTIAELNTPENPKSSGLSGIKKFAFTPFCEVDDKPEYINAVLGFSNGDFAKMYIPDPNSLETLTLTPSRC